jgi:hypothetical protein
MIFIEFIEFIAGWIQEATSFEAIKDTTPADRDHDDMAADLYARLEEAKLVRGKSASSDDRTWPQLPSPRATQSTTFTPDHSASPGEPSIGGAQPETVSITVGSALLRDLCSDSCTPSAKNNLWRLLQEA